MLRLFAALQKFGGRSDVAFLQSRTGGVPRSRTLAHALACDDADEQREEVGMSESCGELWSQFLGLVCREISAFIYMYIISG